MSRGQDADAELLAQLGSEDRAEQRGASERAILRMREDRPFRDALVKLLRGGTPLERFAAAYVLFHDGPSLRPVPALLESLDLSDGDLRWTATHLLVTLGRTQPEVLPLLLHEIAAGPTPRRRRMAIYAARELAPERDETAAAFAAALDDPASDVRLAALSSIAKLVEPGEQLRERVRRLLTGDQDPRMRRIATVIAPELYRGDPAACVEIRELLEQLTATGDDELGTAARLALRRLPA